MGKLPASLFYWGDFARDPNLRRCTHAELGVWMRILCLMHESECRGVLQTNGVAWTDEDIVMAVGGRPEETLNHVTSLVTKGVASRTDSGALMNRRMYREEKERESTRDRVRKHRSKVSGQDDSNGECNAKDTLCTETENETEVLTLSLEPEKEDSSGGKKANIDAIYAAYPRKVGRSAAVKAIEKAFRRLIAGEGDYTFVPDEANAFLVQAARAFARSPAGMAGEYTPHPATWFNQSRYLDNPVEWERGGRHGNGKISGSGTDRNAAAVREFLASRGESIDLRSGDQPIARTACGDAQPHGDSDAACELRGADGGPDALGDYSGLRADP